MGPEVTDYIDSQVFEATYHEVPAHTTRKEPIVISVSAAANECTNTGVMVIPVLLVCHLFFGILSHS